MKPRGRVLMVLDLPAGFLARRDLATADENSTVLEASGVMVEKSRGSVLEPRSEDLIGVLAERDILKKVVAKSLDPKTTRVKEAMTNPPITIDQKEP